MHLIGRLWLGIGMLLICSIPLWLALYYETEPVWGVLVDGAVISPFIIMALSGVAVLLLLAAAHLLGVPAGGIAFFEFIHFHIPPCDAGSCLVSCLQRPDSSHFPADRAFFPVVRLPAGIRRIEWSQSEVTTMCFNNGNNNCSCLWLILIVIVLCCCGGSWGGSNCGGNCGCGGSCGCNDNCNSCC